MDGIYHLVMCISGIAATQTLRALSLIVGID